MFHLSCAITKLLKSLHLGDQNHLGR